MIADALKKIRDAMLTVGPDVFHFRALHKPDQYIVWAEDGGGTKSWSDDARTFQSVQGTVDYFTRMEFDPVVDQIESALNNTEIYWWYNSIQYEPDTGYFHHEWVWEAES